jgi:hypothetical protein
MSPSLLRKVWQPLARSSCWLFFPFTSASVHDDDDDRDKDAQLQSSGHSRHRATTSTGTGTGSSEASSDLGWSTWSPPPVELDTDATTIALAFLLGSATALGASTVYRRFFRRIRSAEWITPDFFGRKRWITGVVTRSERATVVFPRSIPDSS